MGIVKNIAAIAKGMSVTFREMFKPTIVENYPDGPGPTRGAMFQERFRGMHVLQRDENGLEKCVACFLCAAACPSNCIYIEAAENTAEKRISGAERYAKVYNIDYNRCIFCGYCVEACPTDAITHGHGFELATYNASSLVYRKEQLLAGTPGARRRECHLQPVRECQTGPQQVTATRKCVRPRLRNRWFWTFPIRSLERAGSAPESLKPEFESIAAGVQAHIQSPPKLARSCRRRE